MAISTLIVLTAVSLIALIFAVQQYICQNVDSLLWEHENIKPTNSYVEKSANWSNKTLEDLSQKSLTSKTAFQVS